MALGSFNAWLTISFASDTLFCFLLSGGLYAWIRRKFILAGLLLGAATLTRAIFLPIILVVGVLALVVKFNRLPHVKIALAALVIVAPVDDTQLCRHAELCADPSMVGANVLLGTRPVEYGQRQSIVY